jgi:starch phosphorylase
MKAGINGVLNLSVLDGWWGEGYDGTNGWAIKPAPENMDEYRRNKEDSQTLYELLQDQVIPLYYKRDKFGYSPEWVKMAKTSIATLLPRFNASRMVSEYVSRFYLPAAKAGRYLAQENYARARSLAQWKQRVRAAWPGVTLRRLDTPPRRIRFGEEVRIEVGVRLNGLQPEDVVVELLLTRGNKHHAEDAHRYRFRFDRLDGETGEHRFVLDLAPSLCGRLDYRIRAYPSHALLTHPLEMGLMVWL